jgi:hypothetical protein
VILAAHVVKIVVATQAAQDVMTVAAILAAHVVMIVVATQVGQDVTNAVVIPVVQGVMIAADILEVLVVTAVEDVTNDVA